ncbi:MAG: gliding motility-associated C-terminal domain-containing protein, partial [Bacteroidia bacterium]
NTFTGCTSVSLPYIIAPAPAAPAKPEATLAQPDCTNANGSLTIITPLGTDYEYSVDGTNFQPGVIFTLPAGTYTVTTRNTVSGCTSVSDPYTINAAPTAPLQAQATPVDPTCTNANGSLTVTTPLGTDYEYSVDGINFQAGVAFTLTAGTYTIRTRNIFSGCTSVSGSYIINAAPAVVVPAIATPAQPDCSNPNGSLTVTNPLGTDYEYSVDGTNFQPGVIFTLASGTYTITTRNVVSGCTSVSGSYTINAAPAVVVPAIATPAQPDCSNPNGSLTVTNPLGTDYEYSTDGTNFQTAVAFNLPAGTYIVTTRNTVSGCTSVSDPYIINAAPAVVVPAIATPVQPDCSNPNGSLTVTNPLGTDYEYSVDGINFQAGVAFTLTAGTYTVTTRNTVSGCTSVSDPYTINAAPTAPAQAQVNPAQPDCTNANGLLTVTTPVGTDYEYSVDGINFQAGVAFTLTAGTYTITTRNVVSGCTSVSGSYIINAAPVVPPAATAVVTAQPTCASANGTLIITPPAGTGYEFSTDGINFRTNTTLTLPSGSYMLTVRNASGCTAVSGPYVINPAPAAPAAPLATVIPPDCFNATGLIMITSPAGTGYEYSIDGINFQASATFAAPEGSYTITVRNAAGCTAVSASPAVVGPQPAMPAVAQVTVTLPTCTNALGALTVTSPVGTGYEYSLDGINFQTSTLFAAPQGSYSVTVRNAAGCTATSGSFTIGAPQTGLPELGGLQDCRPTINGNNYILEGIAENNSFNMATATFEWRRAGQAMVLSTDTTFNVTEYKTDNDLTSGSFPIDFELTVTTPGGCTDTYTFNVISVVCDIPKGISPNNDTMNDKFDLAGMDVTKITIVNRYGVEVYHRRNYRDEWHGQTDNGQELPTGTYFYMLEMAGGTRTGWVYLNREVR